MEGHEFDFCRTQIFSCPRYIFLIFFPVAVLISLTIGSTDFVVPIDENDDGSRD